MNVIFKIPQESPSQLICGDAITEMARLPANCIDLIIADPPYNLGKDYGNNKDARTSEEYTIFTRSWLEQASSPLCLF